MNLDWEFIVESLPLYGEAMWLTLKIAFFAILFSLVVGLLCSTVLYYKVRGISGIIVAYIELSRNTPLLVQLYFLYYGFTKIGLHMSEMTCAIVGMTFLGGGYMAEAFRGGMEAVSKTQTESGLSLGLSKIQLARYVILPQAFAISVPSLGANAIFFAQGDFHCWRHCFIRSDECGKRPDRHVLQNNRIANSAGIGISRPAFTFVDTADVGGKEGAIC